MCRIIGRACIVMLLQVACRKIGGDCLEYFMLSDVVAFPEEESIFEFEISRPRVKEPG